MNPDEFEAVLKIGVGMAIDILRTHAVDERYKAMTGTEAMLEMARTLATCNIRSMPDVAYMGAEGSA